MAQNEVLAWFKVMDIVPTTAEVLRTQELFDENGILDPDFRRDDDNGMVELLEAPLVRAEQFRKIAPIFFKEIKWWHFLRWAPGVRGVALNNKAAFLAQEASRDFDLFIVASKNTVWLVRFFVTILAIVFNKRRTNKNFAGKWCLAFFLEENVPIQSLALKPSDFELLWWENNLLWLVSTEVSPSEPWRRMGHPTLCRRAFPWQIFSYLAKPFNYLAFLWQKKYFLRKNQDRNEKREARNELSEGVVLTSQVAKFHTVDRRREHLEMWQKLIA